jgi:hypothetical protein
MIPPCYYVGNKLGVIAIRELYDAILKRTIIRALISLTREAKQLSVWALSKADFEPPFLQISMLKKKKKKEEPKRQKRETSPIRHFTLRLRVTKGRKEARRPCGKQEAEWLCKIHQEG